MSKTPTGELSIGGKVIRKTTKRGAWLVSNAAKDLWLTLVVLVVVWEVFDLPGDTDGAGGAGFEQVGEGLQWFASNEQLFYIVVPLAIWIFTMLRKREPTERKSDQ